MELRHERRLNSVYLRSVPFQGLPPATRTCHTAEWKAAEQLAAWAPAGFGHQLAKWPHLPSQGFRVYQ